MSEKDKKETTESPMQEQEEKTTAEEQEEKTTAEEQEREATAEVKEMDLTLKAQELMEQEGVDTIYSAGEYWFCDIYYAEEYAKREGYEVKTYNRD